MSLLKQMFSVYYKIQIIPQSIMHFCKLLDMVYNEATLEEFAEDFLKCLKIAVNKDMKNVYVEQILCFAATFSVNVARKRSNLKSIEGSQEMNPFLKTIILRLLPLQGYRNHNVRFNVCNFIAILFDIIDNEDLIDEHICNYIQKLMIDRLRDVKSAVRIKAIAAIFRLQDPKNEHCQVINAFLQCLHDPNVEIRRGIVEKIAPSKFTLPRIIDCLGDISEKVRAAAFKKCSILPPSYLKITQRQEILRRGFDEESRIAKKAFIEVLLPKWLTYYDTNFLQLLKAIKLDADENDIKETSSLGYNIMKEVFRLHPMDTIIAFLPINDKMLIPLESLSSEMVLYWCAIHKHIVSNDNLDDQLEKVVPDLSPFCTYIESILSGKGLNNPELNDWEKLENQFIVYKLFEMAGNFNFGDEVGRTKLHQLIFNCLSKENLTKPLISTLVEVLGKINTNVSSLIEDVHELITNIIDSKKTPSLEYISERTKKIQDLGTKINQTLEQLDASIVGENYNQAISIDEQLNELIEKKNKLETEQFVCSSTQELFINNRCLDILICLLGHKDINSITPTLLNLKEMHLKSLSNNDKETFKKIIHCCSLYSLIDFDTAKEYLKLLCTPIILYEDTCDYDQETLLISIDTITDLLKIHGPELFANERLDYDTNDNEHAFLKSIIEEIINLLDAKHEIVREHAAVAISQLVYNGIMVTSTIFARILLKWYNPVMEIKNPKGQQLFGFAIEHFVKTAVNSDTVVIEAVIPALNAISRASVDIINVDNMIKFIAAITQLKRMEHVQLHNLLSFKLCSKILEDPEAKAVNLYIKMLFSLQIPKDETVLNELRDNLECIIRAINNVQMKTKLKKYLLKLEGVNKKVSRDNVSCKSSNPDENQHQNNESVEDLLQGNDDVGDYTIQDSDESIYTIPPVKRTLNASIILANSDLSEENNDQPDSVVEQFSKKAKICEKNCSNITESEEDIIFGVSTGWKRGSTTPREIASKKKIKLVYDK